MNRADMSPPNPVRAAAAAEITETVIKRAEPAADASSCIDRFPLAMAYVPMQIWRMVFSPEKALEQGTIFQELDLPFMRGAK